MKAWILIIMFLIATWQGFYYVVETWVDNHTTTIPYEWPYE